MVSFDFTVKISNAIYQWVLDPGEGNPRGSLYKAIFSNDGTGGHGMEYCLFFLLIVSILTAAAYYFIIASNIRSATKNNYFWTYVMGFICLVIINYLGMQLILDDVNVLKSFNMVKLCLIDIAYYTVLFEIASLLMKPLSKAGDIELISLIKQFFYHQ